MIYTFGKEKVAILSQTYREFRFSYLLESSIFGNDFSGLKKDEIIMKSKKQILIHIVSQQRMNEFFIKEKLSATEFYIEKNNSAYMHSCSGKVNLLYNNKNITGYILNTTRGKWKILLTSNKIIYTNPLKYNRDTLEYVYNGKGKYNITFYWPIRFLLRFNEKGMRITLNRVAYNKERKGVYNLVEEHSS